MQPDRIARTGEGGLPGACAPLETKRRVIIVDDDPAVRASLKFSFELEGFAVEIFADADGFAAGGTVDEDQCLVIDYRLPGINGLEMLAGLRSRGCRAPAIIITSHPGRKLRDQIAAAGATLIEKPLLCDALTATVRSLLQPGRPSFDNSRS